MTSRGSRRLLLSGNELSERGRRWAPLLFEVAGFTVLLYVHEHVCKFRLVFEAPHLPKSELLGLMGLR